MVIPFTNLRARVSVLLLAIAAAAALMFVAPMAAWAQSTTSGSIGGVVVDPSNAVIVGAKVVIEQQGTSLTQATKTDTAGRYSFPAVAPGIYTITVSQAGFQTNVVTAANVEVANSYTYNFTLKVGQQSQTVEVTSIPGADLQTTNASIGTTMSGTMIQNLPTIQRNVSSLLGLQPAVTPMTTNDVMGGQVAGAASDQTVFMVDGGDATSDTEGTNSYAAVPGEVEPSPIVQVGVESTSEFRVVSAGPTSNENRAQGGQISIVSKSGTNSFHGSGYEYYQGAVLDANSWANNRDGIDRPGLVNNRFGATFGGPFMKNRFWFFGNYEGRRFRQTEDATSDVPTATARAGELIFPDANGTPTTYNFNPANGALSTACGTAGTTPCDPRGIGVDPLIQKYWDLMPLPNTPGTGDLYNSVGFTYPFPTPDNENYGLLRLDYKINDRWTLFATYRQQKLLYYSLGQYDLISGQLGTLSSEPVLPRYATFGLTGAIGSSFTNEVHGDYLIDFWGYRRAPVANPSAITGLGGVLEVSGEGATGTGDASKPWADPINFNTQNARSRFWDGRDQYYADDATWLHGTHNITFGGSFYWWNITHQRDDNVLGGLAEAATYYVGADTMSSGAYTSIPSSETPPVCSTPTQTLCLNSGDVSRWSTEYASMLGLVDHSSQVLTTNNQFQLNPPGTVATDHVHVPSFYAYVGDEWHLKPTTTVTYGLSYGVQFPPDELSGLQVLQQYASNGQVVENIPAYFQARQASLDRGNPYPSLDDLTNPAFEFSPIDTVPGHTRPTSTYWGSIGPHLAVAWQPPWQNRIFGTNHNTVVRVGYALEWNRTNGVSEVLTPLLGDGLMQVAGCNAPDIAGACNTSAGASTDATDAFRIGIDGDSLPPPTGHSGYPYVQAPGISTTYGFNLDPDIKPAWSNNWNFDVQRSFSHNWLIDVGYIGRFVHDLLSGGDINASDMFAKDPVSGQTLAQAFQAVSNWAQAGGTCTGSGASMNCGTLTAQPFFEDMAVPGGSATAGPAYCQTKYGTSCTFETAASTIGAGFPQNGDLADFMQSSIGYNYIASAPLDPTQFLFNFWNWSGGYSNYNAGFISIKKALSQGLNLSFNYTWSHALGTETLNQQYIIYGNPSPFDPSTGYTAEPYDTRNVFNVAAYYQLPFGKGKRFLSSSNLLDRFVGGWWLSGIWTWQSGQPQCVGADGNYGDLAGGAIVDNCAVGTQSGSAYSGELGQHTVVADGQANIYMFANPTAVLAQFSRPNETTDLRPFSFNFNGYPLWDLDMSLGKNVLDTERFKGTFRVDAFDVFNAFVPADGPLDLDNPPSIFGEVTGQANNPRVVQLGFELTF